MEDHEVMIQRQGTGLFRSQKSDLGPKLQRTKTSVQLELGRKVIIKQFAAQTFKKIREFDNIADSTLLSALNPSGNIPQIQKAGLGAGASGSFFFFTRNKKFILKTISKKEIHHMIR